MAKAFTLVSDKEAASIKSRGRSNVSAPIINDFLEATEGKVGAVAKINAADIGNGERQPDSLFQMLNQYGLNQELPVKAFMSNKEVYLERLETARPKPVKRPKAETASTEAVAVNVAADEYAGV